MEYIKSGLYIKRNVDSKILSLPLSKSGLFHLKNEVTLLHENLWSEESCRIVCKPIVVAGFPSGEIEEIEVISPVQIKHPRLLVICVYFDIVIHRVPWHIMITETYLPLRELWSPEIHHQGLRLWDQFDSWVKLTISTDLATIHWPSNKVWGPFNLINVPVFCRIR